MSHGGEELIIARLIGDIPPGFYVDVGANNPLTSSNTHPFYLRGWRGADVEPLPDMATILRVEHPENHVFECAASDRAGLAILYGCCGCEGATLREDYAAIHTGEDRVQFQPTNVKLRTLNSMLAECEFSAIDFMSIDVEGHELQALTGLDLNVYRPKLICIESIVPCTNLPSFEDWEPYLLQYGYQLIEIDPANRYYSPGEF